MAGAAAAPYFQGGDFVELLNAQGKAPAATWKIQGKILKSFDKAIKGNAFQMEGSSETKMQLPKSSTASNATSLGLTQRFLVLQLLVPHTRSFSIEIGFADFQKIRRRFVISSAFRETVTTTLHVQIPLGNSLQRDQWMNLVFDLHALTEQYFPGSSFRSMESVCVSGSCRLKRIFTMKDAPHCPSLHDKVQALLQAYRDRRLNSANPNSQSVPIGVATFAEMKDIPKQFVFSVGSSYLPIPTEYFFGGLESDPISSGVQAPVIQSKQSNGWRGDVDSTKAKRGVATKPQSAPDGVQRNRPTSSATPRDDNQRGREQKSVEKVRVRTAPREPQRTERTKESAPLLARPASRGRVSPEHRPTTVRSRSETPGIVHQLTDQVHESEDDLTDEDERQSSARSATGMNMPTDIDDSLSPERSPKPELEAHTATTTPKATHESDQGGFGHHSSSVRKQHRQNVIEQIQSKLDALRREADEEDERDRALLLKRTSLSTQDLVTEDLTDRPDHNKLHDSDSKQPSFRQVSVVEPDDWHDKELLRSPEPMVLRRMQVVKKPAISFSSSIFSFDRGEPMQRSHESDKQVSTYPKKSLFDWDSLLDDSAGALATHLVQSKDHANVSLKELDHESISIPLASTQPEGLDEKAHHESAELPNDQLRLNDENSRYRHTDGHSSGLLRVDNDFHRDIDGVEEGSSPAKSGRPWLDGEDHELEDHHGQLSPRADSEGALSLDLTDDLEEAEQAHPPPSDSASPRAITTSVQLHDSCDDEDSFNFDDLVVRDRDYHPPKTQSSAVDKAANTRVPVKSVSLTPALSPPPRAALVDNPPRTQGQRISREPPATPATMKSSSKSRAGILDDVDARRSIDVASSSDRRLAKLLESTDWSQLPLSSVVSPPPESTRRSSHARSDSTGGKSSSPSTTSIDLIYDPILRCYYDPVGKKYYALDKPRR